MLTITISGPPKSGKSTLAEFVLRHLILEGLSANVEVNESYDMLKLKGDLKNRLNSLKDKVITIKTLQTNREPNVQS